MPFKKNKPHSGNEKTNSTEHYMPLIYTELHSLAQKYMRQERNDHTLQATALVHEAYLRLKNQLDQDCVNRAHFVAIAANTMRRILVEHERNRGAQKRGGKIGRISLEDTDIHYEDSRFDLLDLDDVLNKLEMLDQQQGRIVELRFFGGLSIEETAAVLGISTPTVKRDWVMAKAWLFHKLDEGFSNGKS